MNYRDHLPQLAGDLLLTDGGIETVLIFHEGIDLATRVVRPPVEYWSVSSTLGYVMSVTEPVI